MINKIGIASDHGGFELKEHIRNVFESKISIIDYGTYSPDSIDYPQVISNACKKLIEGEVDSLIALCGTGIGASIAANRIKGIRAALCHDEFTAAMSKKHNNSNVLVLGGRVLGKDLAVRIVDVWLNASFEGGRHLRRLEMLDI